MSSSSPSSSSPPSIPATTTTPPTPPLRPLLLTLLLACPLLALLPPRKLDLYTFSLTGAWVLSAEELAFGDARRQRGRGVGGTGVMGVLGRGEMDSGVGSIQSAEMREREGRLRPGFGVGEGGKEEGVYNGKEKVEGEGEGVKGLARRLWMGDERPGWQKRRLEREREELEGGKGYGDIIMDQVREVFPGFGGRRGEEGEGE